MTFDRIISLTRHGGKIREQLFVDLSNTREVKCASSYLLD